MRDHVSAGFSLFGIRSRLTEVMLMLMAFLVSAFFSSLLEVQLSDQKPGGNSSKLGTPLGM